MASSRRRVSDILSRSMPETPTHFFKIVLTYALEAKKLRIPPEFVRKFGHELSNTATLIVPNGRLWQVSLTKDGKNIWFQDGWHDFAVYHSISEGYFLVFKYENNASFQVHIFDLTACEIDYPCIDESSENLKKNVMEEFMEINEPDNEYDLRKSLEEMGIFITEKYVLLSTEEREGAINIAKSLKLKNPSFLVILQPFKKRCRSMYVPAIFAKKFIKKDAKSIKILVSNEKEHSVKIYWRRYGGCYLSRGWAQVSEDNNLKAGDIYLFEVITTKDVLLKVLVFHASADKSSVVQYVQKRSAKLRCKAFAVTETMPNQQATVRAAAGRGMHSVSFV